MTDPIRSNAKAPASRRRWLFGAALAAAFATGGLTVSALGAAAQNAVQNGAMHGMMGGGDHGSMHAMGAAHLTRMLDLVGASADQKAKITAIMQRGFAPMNDMHVQLHETLAAVHARLTAPTVDRGALELLRSREIAQIDQASKTMIRAFADAAEVLTPAQRAKLAALMAEHRVSP
ncbi:MAG: Spy/CpxP family protein refolding chaperone [Pseudomonadota bacterium]|nr:Spy/CpxP family protein refolding chaperone [Pseudomonadota bacterium]